MVRLVVMTTLLPSAAWAEWKDFMPVPDENAAYVESFTSYERDHQNNRGRTVEWQDLYFRQKLTLLSRGFVYHPRFLVYRFSVAGLVREENYDSTSFDDRGWRSDPGAEYDFSLMLLPEHSYNLEAYARRYEPLYKEQSASQHDNVDNRRGFDFRYRQKPFFAHAGFLDDEVETAHVDSRLDRFNVDGQYFERFRQGHELSFNGTFTPSWFSNSEGLDGSSLDYTVGNYFSLGNPQWWVGPIRLTSNVGQNFFAQDSPQSPQLESEQLLWYERLTADLPWNFRHYTYYRHQDSDSDSSGRHQSYVADDIKLDLVHRLYDSLDTTYSFIDNSRDSGGGDSHLNGHSLVMSYAKNIPLGRLYAGFNVGTSDSTTNGQIDVIDEPFSTSLPMVDGPYVLGQQNVDRDSIVVYMLSPEPPFERILLQPPQYSVVAFQNTYGIIINTVPPQFIGPGPFNFLVSYSYAGDYELRTNTVGANFRLQLFNSLVTPYFNYLHLDNDQQSGDFPGGLADSTTYTTGVLLHYLGLQLRGEYQKLDWDVSPYESWRASAQYVQSLTNSTHLFASAEYLHKHYSRGTLVYYEHPFTEESETASADVQQQLWLDALRLSVGGSFAHIDGLSNAQSYSIHSSLVWRIAKTDVSLGVNAYESDSSGSGSAHTRRDHQFVYLNLRRRVF